MARGERRQNLARLGEIAQVAARHGFGYAFGRNDGSSEEMNGAGAGRNRGRRMREMLDELGPTFVKFGQLLSTRPDIVPPDILAELRGLQDDAHPGAVRRRSARCVEEELGLTIEQVFAGVRRGADRGGLDRPGAPAPCCRAARRWSSRSSAPTPSASSRADIQLLYQVARVARERVRKLQFIDLVGTVDEFARTVRRELDYGIEARNAEVFRRDFAGDDRVAVPKIYWRYTTSRVLTMERVEGTVLGQLDLGSWSPDDRRRLGEPDHRDLDADGLRARLLPRRPAPGQHPRARPRPDQPGRLRHDRAAHASATARRRCACCSTSSTRTPSACRGGCARWASATRAHMEEELGRPPRGHPAALLGVARSARSTPARCCARSSRRSTGSTSRCPRAG